MTRNVVKTQGYVQGGKGNAKRRSRAIRLFFACMLFVLQLTAQVIAHHFGYHPALGWSVPVKGYRLYPFYRALYWLYELLSTYDQTRSSLATSCSFLVAMGMLISMLVAKKYYYAGTKALEALHGSAHWATKREIQDAALLDSRGNPQTEGVVVGGLLEKKRFGWKKQTKILRHNGPEHVMCYAPTRSGKGVSLVIPTLLDGWRGSTFVHDLKGENFGLSAGYRQRTLGHKILKLDFTDPFAVSKGTSATFNPLEEVPLDFDFSDDFRPNPRNIGAAPFRLSHTNTYSETASVQQIVSIIVDPYGKGNDDHWSKTASSFMLGCITHLLYKFKLEGKGYPGIADVLSELSRPGEEWQSVVCGWQEYPHLGIREELNAEGEFERYPIPHPVVAEEAQTLLNKPSREAGSVLSTVVANMGLFRDPVVAQNTSQSSFKIRDLMHDDDPVDLYLIISPVDQLRLTPLSRLLITQIVFTLAARMEFEGGRTKETYKHRLLLLLDEFPSLGRLELFERALGFIGGYGLKAYVFVQGLSQLFKAYSKEESIRVGCHIQVAFAPNDMETAEYLSKSTGQMTVIKENTSVTTQEGRLFAGKSRQTTLQEVQRPLMTPDECRRLPGLKKDMRGNVLEAGDTLIFPAGFPCIYGRQALWFQDEELLRRGEMRPPEYSDCLK